MLPAPPTPVEELLSQQSTAREAMERREMALRLSQNSDFKRLILDEFLVKEAARYVQLSSDPNLDPANRADALAIAQAGGHLKRYLSAIIQMGVAAEHSMPQLDEALAEARAEEGTTDATDTL